MNTEIRSRTPVRIDLAGGTLDIWPLYLLLDTPITVNFGIDLFTEVHLVESLPSVKKPAGIFLESLDQNTRWSLPFSSMQRLNEKEIPPGLILHVKILQYFLRKNPISEKIHLSIKTTAKSPAGAGLGGSSSLNVALCGAISAWLKQEISDELIHIAQDIETQVIKVPAGLQDYFSAMYGGLQAIHWKVCSHENEKLSEEILENIGNRALLFYSGQSRNSGINNWSLFKGFIDGNPDVIKKFQSISNITQNLFDALKEENWEAVSNAIAQEWEIRKTLSKGISTPTIDQACFEAIKTGAAAYKICGAGGGGCFFIFLPTPDPELKNRVIQKVSTNNIRHLPFKTVNQGLDVKINHE